MSRTKFDTLTSEEFVQNVEATELDILIPQYAENKNELDSYKKICEKENSQIKDLMLAQNVTTYVASNYKATRSVSIRETFREAALIQLLKLRLGDDTPIIKTKEYVDMDVLEKCVYNGEISKDLLLEMDKCKEVKEVVTLKVTKVNKKEKE